jgi:hypothetical protein
MNVEQQMVQGARKIGERFLKSLLDVFAAVSAATGDDDAMRANGKDSRF